MKNKLGKKYVYISAQFDKKTFSNKKEHAVTVNITGLQPKSIMCEKKYGEQFVWYLDPKDLKSAIFCYKEGKYEIRPHLFRFGGKEICGDSIHFMDNALGYMCLLTKSGDVFWKIPRCSGARIKVPETIKDISVGYQRVFLISISDNIYGYGNNRCGSLGTGTERDHYDNPELIQTLGKLCKKVVTTKDNSGASSFFLMGDFSIYACGSNGRGQLGVGETKNNIYAPKRVGFKRAKIIDVATGSYHTLFLSKRGELFGCGMTRYGQLGSKINKNVLVPIKIPFNEKIKYVFAGCLHSFFVTQANTVHLLGELKENRSFNHELENLAGKKISRIYMSQTIREKTFFTNNNGEVFFSATEKPLTANKANFTVKPYSAPNSEHFNKVMDQQERLLFVMNWFAFFVSPQQKSESNSNRISDKRQMLTI